ncbi:hypothetical protein B0H66DRAFT_559397 [Apodospora peruviana]|uniref:Uncharacterized protein n=1 Tax=Apodospora peruviana TaxID=516989 RepID=A0AAE0M666_9PEZI|nr:hypothetical protein B0H66DRAFT_559397 [Apodospora peruviana]
MAPATETPPAAPAREMKILCLGLMRSGTYSIYTALTMLGYKNVYHGLNSLGNNADWAILNAAADATFPSLPSHSHKPFTVAEWDQIWGSCEAVTDVASVFGPQLIDAYPDAKVVLVQRDFEKWSKSINETVINSLWGAIPDFFVGVIEPMIGSVAGPASRKMLLGWAEANDAEEMRANLRVAWERHHDEIRDKCRGREGKLLEFKLADGWEPLCEFLGREVPRDTETGEVVPFPHANEAKALRAKLIEQQVEMLKKAGVALMPWMGALGVAGAGWWWWWFNAYGM